MTIEVRSLDHLVLTCRNVEASIAFYCDLLGMRRESFGEGRFAVVSCRWRGGDPLPTGEG